MMNTTVLISYIILIVIAISAIIVKRDTRDLIRRSDAIQKSLNAYIKKETHK